MIISEPEEGAAGGLQMQMATASAITLRMRTAMASAIISRAGEPAEEMAAQERLEAAADSSKTRRMLE